jgi:F420-dependent oxidoreductase-like protein
VYTLGQLRIFTEPQQGATYDDLLAVARRAETLGFDAFFRSDHYMAMGGADAPDGLPGSSDAWITLAGLARDTSSIRLGTLVTPATFRHPGVLAISVANVDQMSGGRVELGLGAGWYREEHEAYGLPFPGVAERFERLAEQLEIVTGLWQTHPGERFDFAGKHVVLHDSPALPKPVQHPVPIIVGGAGRRRTPELAARFATEFNMPFRPIERFVEQRGRVVEACATIGRDPATLVFSTALTAAVGRTEAEAARRAAAIGSSLEDLRRTGVAGTIDEAVASLRKWQDAGAERMYLQVLDLADLDHLDSLAATAQ